MQSADVKIQVYYEYKYRRYVCFDTLVVDVDFWQLKKNKKKSNIL